MLVLGAVLPAAATSRGICLSRDPSPPDAVGNDGTYTVKLDWSTTLGTTCTGYKLEFIDPSTGQPMASQTQTLSCATTTYTWTVPSCATPGCWYAKLTLLTNWCTKTEEDIAQVGIIVLPVLKVCKFNDLNGNGTQETGEGGLSGWTIIIRKTDGTQVATGTTDSGGCVKFLLPADSYKIEETIPTGSGACWVKTGPQGSTNPFPFTVANCNNNVSIGNWQAGTLTVCKFNDLNGNGTQDSGEGGLSGWTIIIRKMDGTQVTTGTTGSNGCITFTLPPDQYKVEETIPTGSCWVKTGPQGNANPITTTVTACSTTNISIGNWQPATVRFYKFNDLNGNGTQDTGEPAIPNWQIKVTPPGGTVTTLTTDANGYTTYITGPVGNYSVQDVIPTTSGTCWIKTTPQGSTNPFTVALAACSNPDIKIGNWQPATFTLCKFNDLNGNGTMDTGETTVANWQFKVTPPGGTATVYTTASNGKTSAITGPAGNWTIEDMIPQGTCWVKTGPQGSTNPFTMNMVACDNGIVNVGNQQTGALTITKFNDLDGDGVKDNGETGLAGWDFKIEQNGVLIKTVTTKSGGSTDPCTLPVGSYKVTEVIPQPPQGTCPWVPTTGNSQNINITNCGAQTLTFGNWQPATFKICKFNDLNGNGTQETGEPYLTGWQFKVTKPGASQSVTYTTGADGCTDVISGPAGSWTIEDVYPAGQSWVKTTPQGTTNPFNVTMVACDNGSIKVGNWQPTITITGHKYLDVQPWPWCFGCSQPPSGTFGCLVTDLNDPLNQQGQAGVTIVLHDKNNNVIGTAVTDSNGYYHFDNVPWSANYTVVEAIPQAPDVPHPSEDTVCPLCKPLLTAQPGGYEPTLATTTWHPNGQSDMDCATPGDLLLTFTQPPTAPNQTFGGNNFYNTCLGRIWGTICTDSLALLQNPVVKVEKVVNGVVSAWPAGNSTPCADCGTFIVGALANEPQGIRSTQANSGVFYRLTSPALPSADYHWTVTVEGIPQCNVTTTTNEDGTVTVELQIDCGADIKVTFCLAKGGTKCFLPVTLTQQDWKNLSDPNTLGIPGGMVYNRFPIAFANFTFYGTPYKNTLIAGGVTTNRYHLAFGSTTGSITRLVSFLPQTGPCGKLSFNYTDPTTTSAGVLAGEVVALTMNVAYNDMRLMPRTPGYDLELYTLKEGLFKGKTVGQVLDIANRVLGGDPPSWYGLPDCATLVQMLQAINANYQMSDIKMFTDRGYLTPNASWGPAKPAHTPHVP